MARSCVHPGCIKDFELANGTYDTLWPHRCDVCDLPCSSSRGIAIHKAKAHAPEKQQQFTGSIADAKVKTGKLKRAQANKVAIFCGDNKLENTFSFTYLGTLFSADADQTRDIKVRIALASQRFGKLRQTLCSPDLSLKLKLRLYEAAICSILVYGCESWALNAKAMRTLNGINSKMLSRFTGRSIQEEARPLTTSLNLVRKLRIRRHKWLGHILRGNPTRLIAQAVDEQRALQVKGGLLMDAPPHSNLDELKTLAADRAAWADLQKDIPLSHYH